MHNSAQDVNRSLSVAVHEGRLQRAREIIDTFGLSYSKKWHGGFTLLRDALKDGQIAFAKLLLTCDCKVNKEGGMSPLHYAAKNGDVEIIQMILDKGAIVNAKSRRGRTPLHMAIENKNVEVYNLLLKYKADYAITDRDRMSPLHFAAQAGCFEIAKNLLDLAAMEIGTWNYANWVCTYKWKKYTPLHFAVENGSEEIVLLLLSRGAIVDVEVEGSISLFHIASGNGSVRIVEILLNHGSCIHSRCSSTGKENYTALHFACEVGHKETVKLLIDKGADVNAKANDNSTPLHIATKYCQSGHNQVVKLLLEHGADVDKQDMDGNTMLHLAVGKGDLMMVHDILKYHPDINNESNRNSLIVAAKNYGKNYEKIVSALLEYGFEVKPEDAKNPKLLHVAVTNGYSKIAQDLLKYGADDTSERRSKLLHSATEMKLKEVVELLIECGVDINSQNEIGRTPVFYATMNGDFKIFNLLLTNGADIKDPILLFNAVKSESKDIIAVLLQHGLDVNAINEYGRTPLHFIALNEYGFRSHGKYPESKVKAEIAKLLINKGANVDAETPMAETPLHYAAKGGCIEVAKVLLECNANVNAVMNKRNKLLHFSPQIKNDNDTEHKYGKTALHLATKKRHTEVVKILLEWGAKIDCKTKNGLTPLHMAARMGHQEMVKIILQFGADIDSKDEGGRTALHVASRRGRVETVSTLLNYGSDVNITSRFNCTPLEYVVAEINDGGMTYFHSNDDNSVSSDSSDYYDYGDDDGDYDSYDDDNDSVEEYFSTYDNPDTLQFEAIAEALQCHLIKMKTANLYVSKKNLRLLKWNSKSHQFQDKCKEEILLMMREKIRNANISFHDILAKNANSLAICMMNENIAQVLKLGEHKTKFPIYSTMIENKFRKGMERKELHQQGYKMISFLFGDFPALPHVCLEEIVSYLSNEDLRILKNACVPSGISGSSVNVKS